MAKTKAANENNATQTTETMKVELRDIPQEYQRSIEQNLRISRAAEAKKVSGE